MKRFLIFIAALFFTFQLFGQSKHVQKLQELYDNKEYVKCIQRCNNLIQKNDMAFEAYYIKAISYYEIAQFPAKYKDFTRDPMLECVRALGVLRSKDEDDEIWSENEETLKMIYKYGEYTAQQLKSTNKDKAIVLYQRLNRTYRIQTNALELANIYAKVGEYEKCMTQISRLYEKSPANISPSHDNYNALCQGAHLLAENWMFRDLFWIVKTYKPKFEDDYAINEGFKSAIMLSIDTAQHDEDKSYFLDFTKKGLHYYGDNPEFKKFVIKQWKEVIDKELDAFRITEPQNRTWRDSILLRNGFQFLEMAIDVMPNEQFFVAKKKNMDTEFHTVPYYNEQDIFKKYALETVNQWRTAGCECDTGEVFKIMPVYEVEWDTTLARLAEEHAQEMFAHNFTDHISIDGRNPWDRINSTLLKGEYYETEKTNNFIKATKIGETLGYGYSLANASNTTDMQNVINAVVTNWMTSRLSRNCPKIMTPNFTHMGLAVYGDKWVLLFANISDIVIKTKR